MSLEIQVIAWDRHNNVAGLNQLMDYIPSSLITESPTAIHTY